MGNASPANNNEGTEAEITDVETERTNDVSRETYEVESPVYKPKDGYSAVVTPADVETDQNVHANTFTDDEHVNGNTEENKDEEDLEPENGAYSNNNPRTRKQSKNAYFRITSVVDTVKNGSEDLSSKIFEGNKAKNSLDLENSPGATNVKDRCLNAMVELIIFSLINGLSTRF